MDTADRTQLLQFLHRRRAAIADCWHQAIAGASSAPLDATEVRQRLLELTDQLTALLLAESFEHGQAEAIGAALARLGFLQPEALGRTQEVLACQLLEGLSAGQVVALQPRLAALLGGLATGFLQEACHAMLADLDQIRRALDAECRRTEQALQENKAQWRALLSASTDPMLVLDPDGTIVVLNEAAARGLGKSQDELVGVSAMDVLPPEVAQCRRTQGERVISSGQPIRFEDHRGGRWFDQIVYPIFDAQGKVVRIAVIAHDITERKRMEEALQESELRYRTFFESVPVGVGLATLDGQILECNNAMLEMMGYSRAEAGQINLRDIYKNPEDRARLLEQLQTDASVRGFEVELKRKDGTLYWASLTMTWLPEGDEDVFLTVAQDITEHRHMERHLLVAERLAAVGRFAATLAHEVNNPLQAIRSNLELVLDFDLEPDERHRYLQVVRQEIEDLEQITQRALGLAHPNDDTRYPVRIANLVERTLALVDGQLQRARVQVTTDLPAELPRVFVAPDQIVQVLLNLTINAIEAMPDGGRFHVRARVDGDMLALALTNDGSPISPEHIERVFDVFFTTKQEGTGLGLPISYTIVQRHGGTMRVENLGGDQGVTFVVELPVARMASR